MVIAFDAYPYTGGTYPQTIFSIRNNGNQAVSFTVQISNTFTIRVAHYVTAINDWQIIFSGGDALTPSKQIILSLYFKLLSKNIDAWNRVIVEMVQAQPSEFGVGYCSCRIWINGVSSARSYFADFGTGHYLFHDRDNVEVNFCARRIQGGSTPLYTGSNDLMNFIWFKGSEGLYVPAPSK